MKIYKVNELYENKHNIDRVRELFNDKFGDPLKIDFKFKDEDVYIKPIFSITLSNDDGYNFSISYKTNSDIFSIYITSTYNSLYKDDLIKLDMDSINYIKRLLNTISSYVKGNVDEELYTALYKCNNYKEINYKNQHKWIR